MLLVLLLILLFLCQEATGVTGDSLTPDGEAAYWSMRYTIRGGVEKEGTNDVPVFLASSMDAILVTGAAGRSLANKQLEHVGGIALLGNAACRALAIYHHHQQAVARNLLGGQGQVSKSRTQQ